ncbi:hypothetical protein [Derxia gummosa]|uniref:Uncharacterized protein n=1 Tax=Derxia gummosa DSM 723 TaxID=1121388 RepID=A0A8B6X292_9BURK|nr:hypothetical protein [Derxia gummosa]
MTDSLRATPPARRLGDHLAFATALALTLVMAWAAADSKASYVFPLRLHVQMHFLTFALFGAVWARGLPRVNVLWIVGAIWAFGFAHEGWQIIGHRHGFETHDAIIDGLGGTAGALLMRLATSVSLLLPRGNSGAAG